MFHDGSRWAITSASTHTHTHAHTQGVSKNLSSVEDLISKQIYVWNMRQLVH